MCPFVLLHKCALVTETAETEQQEHTEHSQMFNTQLLSSASGTENHSELYRKMDPRELSILTASFLFIYQMPIKSTSAPVVHLHLRHISFLLFPEDIITLS